LGAQPVLYSVRTLVLPRGYSDRGLVLNTTQSIVEFKHE
jgi:hypothetical protein